MSPVIREHAGGDIKGGRPVPPLARANQDIGYQLLIIEGAQGKFEVNAILQRPVVKIDFSQLPGRKAVIGESLEVCFEDGGELCVVQELILNRRCCRQLVVRVIICFCHKRSL